MSQVVPEIIHQIWFNFNHDYPPPTPTPGHVAEIPPKKWNISRLAWISKYPTWTYMLWDEALARELIKTEYSWFLRKYDSYPFPIQRTDAARYFILHKHGGVYCDLDVQPVGNLPVSNWFHTSAQVFPPDVYVMRNQEHSSYSNTFIASIPKADVWNYAFRELFKNPPSWAVTKQMVVLYTTGMAFTRAVNSNTKEGTVGILPGRQFSLEPVEQYYLGAFGQPVSQVISSSIESNSCSPAKSWCCSSDLYLYKMYKYILPYFTKIVAIFVTMSIIAIIAAIYYRIKIKQYQNKR